MSDYITEQEEKSNPPIAETENMRVYQLDNNLLVIMGDEEGELVVSIDHQFQELRILLDRAHGHLKAKNRK